ncbi:hypothetical protein EKO29_17865 [Colwellia sp. Arc7-635]|uniref:outer membrane protein assembly factor BamB family protein n=1 Tax=Colwellia sp. Arc7-635 TaxID=2497879 RepID=UPI000F8502DB|nr:PQQ-binding-like beta-propeller repeat protein [Colwellia sp. Arc7-635]AZQ85697.1 hypothetical protein EKO29_17865 [Colwellia sp. Arc7-635]
MQAFGYSVVRLIGILSICALSACGGGGGGNESPPNVIEPPKSLTLFGAPVTSVDEMQVYAFQVSVKNQSSANLVYSVQNIPSWGGIDPATGLLSGTPNFDDSGSYSNVIISVSDGTNTASLPAFAIEVFNVNRSPKVVSPISFEVLERKEIALVVEAVDADMDDVIISLQNHPDWLSFDESSSSLIGTPSLEDSGSYQFNIILDDGGEEAISTPVSLLVNNAVEIRGKVIDGYISGALVFIDENLNNIFDESEFSTTTDDTGSYILVMPLDNIELLSTSPIRAYVGAGAKDLSRTDLDFTATPITLSLPPIEIANRENDLIEGMVISPFTDQLFNLVSDKLLLMTSGQISLDEMQFYIEKAKQEITRKLIAENNISVNATDTEAYINSLVFGDFLASPNNLSAIAANAAAYVDILIYRHPASDFDGDGIANDIDTDDDGDGIEDSIDLFPFDASEWLDSDGDGVGDNADAYPDSALCFVASDGDGNSCYLALLADNPANLVAISEQKIAYLYQDNGTLVTFDLVSQHVLNTQTIDNVTSMIFHEQHQRLYLGLDTSALKYLADDYAPVDFVTGEQCVNALVEASALLIVLDCRGYAGTYLTFNVDGDLLAESDNYYDSSRVNGWNASMNRLYHFRDGISPNDLFYRTVSNAGEFIDVHESPYHGDYQITGPIIISNDGSKVLLGSGDLYDATTLNWLGSIGEQFTQSFWLDNGDLVTLSQQDNDGNTTLRRRDVEFNLVEIKEISGNVKSIKAFVDKAIFMVEDNENINFINYLPSNDNDNDGVINIEDAFPLDNSASLDSDFDGYPDSWNEGLSGENSNLAIDEFPLDSACWLASHGDNSCNFLSTQPNFTPDKIVYDNAGDIYFLSTINKRIYRWSSATKQFTNPIILSSNIYRDFGNSQVLAYSGEHNRIYVGYDSGVVSRFDLAELKEVSFVALSGATNGIASVGNFILVENRGGAGNTHYIVDRNSEVTDSKEFNFHSDTYAWNEQNSRVYFLRDGASPNDLHYETIDQTLGHITESGDSPYHSSHNIRHPVRISADGDFILLGSGSVFNVDDLTLTADLDLFAADIISAGDFIYSVEHNNDSSTLNIWKFSDFSLIAALEFTGAALALTPDGDELNLVSRLNDGSLVISAVGIVDADQDGLPLWWESLYNFDDNDAADAAVDSDSDGLTNLEEYTLKTNPVLNDTDNDGLLDGAEVNAFGTSPLIGDTDGDGLSDGIEVNDYGTDPLLADSDDDGLTDREEVQDYFSNPLSNDTDGDGLSDLYEITHQLNINVNDAVEDADNDGLINLDEMTHQTNPNNADSDGDGLNDGDEVHLYLTLPLSRDSDGDRMPDGWEVRYAFAPLSNADRDTDFDSDGFSNQLEFFLATDPTDINSVPVVEPWGNYQGNAGHSGFIATNVDINDLSLRWSVTLDDVNNISTAIAADGRILVTSYSATNDKSLINLNSANGAINWKNTYSETYSISEPAYKNNTIYFQASDAEGAKLYATDIVSGDNVFVSEYDGNFDARIAPTVTGDGVYLTGWGHKMDQDTGELLWSKSQYWCGEWSPAVDEENYYYFSDGFKIADKDTGEVTQSNSDESYMRLGCLTPSYDRNSDIYAVGNSQLVAFDRQTADTLWSINADENQSYEGRATVAMGQIYVLRSGELVAIDQYSGEILWTWKAPNNNRLFNNIIATTNLIFVQDNHSTYAIDITTQEQVWSYPASGLLSLSNEGALFIVQNSGVIIAINIGGDSDGDGIDDWWEDLYDLNSQDDTDALLDGDTDGLTNLEEFQYSTNPLNSDSDNDGLSDSEEINTHGSNPLNNDSDGDGMTDGWEVINGLNLLDEYDAFLDADGDGVSNFDEYIESTNPHDESSKPSIIETLLISFEDAVIPDNWVADQALDSDWGISGVESTEGDYSIFSSGQSAISFDGFFNGNVLEFDVKGNCQYSSNLSIYLDGQFASRTSYSEDWKSSNIIIPRGRHTVTFKVDDCGIYLDNLHLRPLESLFEMNVQTVTITDQLLNLYDFEQQQVLTINIPQVDDSSRRARDLTVLNDGRIAIYNGTFNPSLSIYHPQYGTWQHRTFDNWGTINDRAYGGIADSGDYVYVTDMSIAGNNTAGIVRFNLETNVTEFFDGEEYIDVVIGLDNMLYALSGRKVDQYNPVTMVLVNSFVISEAIAISVDENGNIYTASRNGILKRYNQAGIENHVLTLTDLSDNHINGSFYDMNWFEHSRLILTNSSNQVVVISADFTEVQLQNDDFRAQFIATVPVIDEDADGMPAWWERKYELSDTNADDALEDLDADGLSNLLEFLNEVDPSNADTDNDALNDFSEISIYLTNPNVFDTDKDGLSDGEEVLTYDTEPRMSDTDGDTFNDGDEVLIYETDPNDVSSAPDSITELSIDFSTTLSEHWLANDGSDSPWLIENEVLRSGVITHSQESLISYQNLFSAGTLTFESRLDSESCCDFLEVLLDGMLKLSISNSDRQTNTINLSAGPHVITFRYRKDSSVNQGEDAVFIDNLSFTIN